MKLLESIHPSGFLSFGPHSDPVELESLNVLIGPNGCGKSNLIEALDVLRSAPGDLPVPIRRGGGVADWMWKGQSGEEAEISTLKARFAPGVLAQTGKYANRALLYTLAFGAEGTSFVVLNERLENASADPGKRKPYFYFGYEEGIPMLNVAGDRRKLARENIDRTQSILSQRKDQEAYPELFRTGVVLANTQIYRSWSFGPNAPIRQASDSGARTDRLSETFDNLPNRLAALKRTPALKRRLIELVQSISDGFTDLEVIPEGARMQLYVTEGERNIPALRLSDGTLRMLALGSILLDPPRDSMVVIEEPELGLHPDLMPIIRDLLLEASQRAQIIVTSHSTVLADAFTEHPECVVVVDKEDCQTSTRRLARSNVVKQPLGQLWMSGFLGGTRW